MSTVQGASERANEDAILSVRNLVTHFFVRDGEISAVEGISLHVKKGETVAIVGESGCGKSVAALSMLRLIPSPPGKILAGSVFFEGKDILKMSSTQLRNIRGKGIALILQEPMSSLNPSWTIGRQIMEAVELNQGLKGKEAREKALEMLRLVRIPAPESRMENYPHELSGGMKQRVMIAIALACRPKVLIADEPTTSLDVTIQAQILELIKQLKTEIGMTLVLITHDLGVVAEMADRVSIMYAGQIMENADVFSIFHSPAHPYTKGIVNTVMDLKNKNKRLEVIPGDPPSLLNPPPGCRFAPRCEYVQDICRTTTPEYKEVIENSGPWVKCHFPLL
ncbi:ABC transporter ATP-binding protein [Tepidanaerobacter syntrophicus]|uniref:ABC transporter ATP-binding protein n=1 Tax=Tepidanaerobacter syntrophicus TaxID=224999 RepID=UPI0022EF3AF3|nr:ABC transporter ATP-binding protein [Tepidanaerobacter syntrophicus]GLI20303.1 ABC transporter ATP-binding protein [Tepidanaerobacter syntrophicus]GLI51605.1 ABC transporter ATP-binding protein [Tepidanaerobacter syntrophicus]